MAIPVGDGVLSSTWLSRVLDESHEWPHGAVRILSTSRVGTEHGLSGRIHRVAIETKRGGLRSVVVKQETAAAVERELLFRRHCGELLRGSIPHLFGGVTDEESGRGVLVLEHVAPAEQGDVLRGCTDDQAEAVVRVLARLHGSSLSVVDDSGGPDLPRWTAHPMERERWRGRLDRARQRFPEIVAPIELPLLELPKRVVDAGRVLSERPASWLQVDAHLDNTLFRPNGTVVLLDWCNAAIGPPVIDLTRFLTEGVVDSTRPEKRTRLLSCYAEELRRSGLEETSLAELASGFELALLPLLQGAVGWAGRDDLQLGGRMGAVCESFLRSMCSWVTVDAGSQPGSRAV